MRRGSNLNENNKKKRGADRDQAEREVWEKTIGARKVSKGGKSSWVQGGPLNHWMKTSKGMLWQTKGPLRRGAWLGKGKNGEEDPTPPLGPVVKKKTKLR